MSTLTKITPKEAAINVWKAFGSRDEAAIRAALTPDAKWIAPPGNATAVASGATAEQMLTVDGIVRFLTRDYLKLFPEGAKVEFTKVIAEGDTVMMEQLYRAKLANGRTYENRYCWVMEVRDGRVCEMREYMDTHRGFAEIFGDEAPRKLI